MSNETPPDRTGAPTTVTREAGRFVIEVDGRKVGLADFHDRDGRRIFPHTEVLPQFQGRGLATILVAEALRETKAEGLRVVPTCWMVAEYVDRHPEYADIADRA
ncbi:GNAT family N-acetyltransferase [Mycobacterium sp. NAZ190054]|uniref:GNAT family N-acetyltransferase n=1 Tax=Mycobacterium sp. NAZ190054 TaxID=1747766 RepID=UPI0007989F7D|nr:GNAT family N-acetyltransferase [Mycobacterium sp. NAZ190054]KWX67540.1 acetyltransferase [Mycobacterium sp. NAZ190054]